MRRGTHMRRGRRRVAAEAASGPAPGRLLPPPLPHDEKRWRPLRSAAAVGDAGRQRPPSLLPSPLRSCLLRFACTASCPDTPV